MDAQVQQVINELKKYRYEDGATPQDGRDALLEMIAIAKCLVTFRVYTISEKLSFITNRLNRLNDIQKNVDEITEETQLSEKYIIFRENAIQTLGISKFMDEVYGNINTDMIEIMEGIRMNKREITELGYTISRLSKMSDFYSNAKEDLKQIEEMLIKKST